MTELRHFLRPKNEFLATGIDLTCTPRAVGYSDRERTGVEGVKDYAPCSLPPGTDLSPTRKNCRLVLP